MSFIWPAALFSLFLIPVLIGFYLSLQRRRSRLHAQYGALGLVQNSSGQPMGRARHIPAALMLAGLSVLLVASARPQAEVSLPRIEGTVILAFDVSGSMAADDLEPTRMEAAKAAAREFVDQQPPSVEVGIVAFSDSGFSVQPPTSNKDEILAAINRLTPQRGTSVANGIIVSLRAIAKSREGATHFYSQATPEPAVGPIDEPSGRYESAAIVLLTDGENNEQPDPLAAAQTAADHAVRVHTVGIGSPEGTTLHVNGFTVHTRLDEATLQQIAQITRGTYYNAASTQELTKIYSNLDPEIIVKPEKIEVTSIFAGVSAILLLLGGLLSLAWFSRLP